MKDIQARSSLKISRTQQAQARPLQQSALCQATGQASKVPSVSESEVRELFRQGDSKDVQFALDTGFIEGIIEAVIPKDALHVNLK